VSTDATPETSTASAPAFTTAPEIAAGLRALFPARDHAVLFDVADGTGGKITRRADAIVQALWPSRGLWLAGVEIKVSRGDWLRELKDAGKADAIARYCVAADTKVLTEDLRWTPAGDLALGARLIGFDEDTTPRVARQWRPAVVTAHAIEPRPVWRIVTERGTSVRCTADHRWLVGRGGVGHCDPVEWMETAAIAARVHRGRKTYLPRYAEPWTERTDYGTGYLAAAFDGEGSLPVPTHTWRLSFAQKDNAMLAEVIRHLVDHGFDHRQHVHHRARGALVTLRPCTGFHEVLRFLGQVRPQRLLANWRRLFAAHPRGMRTLVRDRVVAVESCGTADVAVMETSTGTFIAEGYASHNCDYWYLAVSDRAIVRDGELPAGWGLIAPQRNGLRIVLSPAKLEPVPMTPAFRAALLRAAQEVGANEAQLKAARAEARAEGVTAGERHAHWEGEHAKRRVRELEESLGALAEHGVMLSKWNARDIAAAMRLYRLLRAGSAPDLLRVLEGAANSADVAARELRGALEAVRAELAAPAEGATP